ncbi:NAD(P)/FAD-dependent oxidoreductase [Algiphilus sp.]|uniref:flavin-containing monooxygenase n=1 Tax=Algiphilus sp. TaxID=1872431 RepID=UPI002A676BD9|nr:NAD(P)/FAD-dependent oxidoreductase [Pseudomonadota bacterium]
MSDHDYDVLIVGAGLSGIGAACHLQREQPQRRLAILERRQRLGGTWDLFRYPGIRSDSDIATFSFGFKPLRSEHFLADGPTIRGYLEDTVREYGLGERIHYGLNIVEANWSSAEQRWTLTAIDEASGAHRRYVCRFLICGTGYYNYNHGYRPHFPGEQAFEGQWIHPQAWPQQLDYSGKRVLVIGSGATAVTLVPAMAQSAAHVTMLQRSPSYIFSLPNTDHMARLLGRVLPRGWVDGIVRGRNIAIQRCLYMACRAWPKTMRRLLLARVRRQLGPAADMRHFTPDYLPWDERLCFVPDGDLLRALRAGQASVVTDTIETFTADGVQLASGTHLQADIVVTATGLDVQLLGGMTVKVDGVTPSLHHKMSYKGLLIEDVPNLAWIIGYTNASWTLKADLSARYLCRLLAYMEHHGLGAVTPKDQGDHVTEHSILDSLQSGYVRRGGHRLPRQGRALPWRVLMHYGLDRRLLLKEPIEDGFLRFEEAKTGAGLAAREGRSTVAG